MGFDLDITISALTVFLQGILSFFSPCVLPIVPLYIGYLSSGASTQADDGTLVYNQKKVLFHTISFVVGVSSAFFILGFGATTIGKFFAQDAMLLARIGGIIVIFLGLNQLGIFGEGSGKELRLPIKLNIQKMTPITALLMGFAFSFAWTPCVGPALSTVLIMASSAQSQAQGFMLIGVYTLGFVIPFLAVGIFTTSILNLFQKYRKVVAYTVKVGGVLMVAMGIMMVTGWMNGITGYLARISLPQQENSQVVGEAEIETESDHEATSGENQSDTEEEADEQIIPAIDFTLKDQFGNEHTLEDYRGKVVFLNFWATWCPPCREEMPDIQKLYENYGYNEEDVIILGIAAPYSEENSYTQEQDEQGVIQFLEDGNYTYPTLMDTTGSLVYEYGISAWPTTFMIDVDGNVFGYLPGMMTYDIMESIIKQTQEGR